MCPAEIKYGEKIWSLKKHLWFSELEDIVCSIHTLTNGERAFYAIVKRVSELIVLMVSAVHSEQNSSHWRTARYGDYICYNNNKNDMISNWEVNEPKYVF